MKTYILLIVCFLLREASTCIRRTPARIKPLRKDRWMPWSEWSSCSVSCGTGEMGRKRVCAEYRKCPAPSELELRRCVLPSCESIRKSTPRPDGGTSEWGPWSPCPTVCGETAYTVRTLKNREKNSPERRERNPCPVINCPINGGWSGWGSWTSCSVTCEVGTRYRYRTCTMPEPKYGGKACEGAKQEATTCFPERKYCQPPVNGGWSKWTDWSSCSKSCQTGSQFRTRTCTNPAPAFDGTPCTGSDRETQECATQPCAKPVNGGWGSWMSWSICSVRCGEGTKNRIRLCNNPPPAHGGQKCTGDQVEMVSCLNRCPVAGGWTDWKPMEECQPISRNKPCSAGHVAVNRKCENPKPQFGGAQCSGVSVATHKCWFLEGCPKELQKPTDFTTLSYENRSLLITWKEAPFGARATSFVAIFRPTADGSSEETKVTIPPAPDSDSLVEYRQYSKVIDVSRLTGTVTVRLEAEDSLSGMKASTQSETFVVGSVDGHWSKWTYWTTCSATCGNGVQRRMRSCNNPSPSKGGRPCTGKSMEARQCDSGRFCL